MELKVLLGFRDVSENIMKSFHQCFEKENLDYDIEVVNKKRTIREAIENNKLITAVVVQHALENANMYTAEELIYLSELNENIKLIIIAQKNMVSEDFLPKLLNAGITTVVFEEDAKVSYITELIKKGRTRKEAKFYYGITETIKEPSKEILVNGEVIARDKIKHICKYIQSEDSEETLKERLDHVLKMIKEEDFIYVLGALERSVIEQIKQMPEYEEYFLRESPQIKSERKGIKSLLQETIGGNGRGSEDNNQVKATIVTEKRKVIGVLGLQKNVGTTFVAVNLAKQIADLDNEVVYMEIPRNNHFIYRDLNLSSKIGYSFVSVPQMILNNNLNCTGIKNIYEGINFFVSNPEDYLNTWKTEHTAKLINSTNDIIVMDLSYDLQKVIDEGIFNLLTDIVMVVNNKDIEDNVSSIRDTTNIISLSGVNGFVVYVNSKKNNLVEHSLLNRYESSNIPTYKVSNDNLLVCNRNDYEKLLQVLNFVLIPNRNSRQKRMQVVVNNIGRMEIAITSTHSGVGKTHTAIMLANVLRYHYRVCIVEQNNSNHFKNLCETLNCNQSGAYFSYVGIDFFYDISYSEFSRKYRSLYDYIIIDYGELPYVIGNRARMVEDFVRCDIKIVLTNCAEWRMNDVTKIMPTVIEYDETKDWIFMVPFTKESQFKRLGMRDLCQNRKIYSIPFCQNPVDENSISTDLFTSILGIKNSTKRGFFRKGYK